MYYELPETIELELELQQNRIDRGLEKENDIYVARTAAVQQREREKGAERMLRNGWSPTDISELLRVPLYVVQGRVARLEEEKENEDGKTQLEKELAILEGDFS